MNKEIKIGNIVEVYTGNLEKILSSDFSREQLDRSEIEYGFIKLIENKNHKYFIKFFSYFDKYSEQYGVHETRILRVIDSESLLNE